MVAQIDRDYIRIRPLKILPRIISYCLFEGRPVTTRGQWINPIVFYHLSVLSKLPQFKKVEKPIFILGVGRSGTTILGMLMSMHRDVGFLNEPKAIWHTIHPREDVGGSYYKGEACYRLDSEDVTPEIRKTAHKLYGGYLAEVSSTRVVDKYPELSFRVPFVLEIFPDAKFIFLIRDGRETSRSIRRWSSVNGQSKIGVTHDWWGVDNQKWRLLVDKIIAPNPYFAEVLADIRCFDNQVDMAAVEWIATMQEGIELMRKYPESIHGLKYENLIDDPDSALKEVMSFCGLSNDKKVLDYARKVLRRPVPHDPLDIHDSIRPLFQDTLDYLYPEII